LALEKLSLGGGAKRELYLTDGPEPLFPLPQEGTPFW